MADESVTRRDRAIARVRAFLEQFQDDKVFVVTECYPPGDGFPYIAIQVESPSEHEDADG